MSNIHKSARPKGSHAYECPLFGHQGCGSQQGAPKRFTSKDRVASHIRFEHHNDPSDIEIKAYTQATGQYVIGTPAQLVRTDRQRARKPTWDFQQESDEERSQEWEVPGKAASEARLDLPHGLLRASRR